MEFIISFLPAFGIVALFFVFWKNSWVSKQPVGDEKMSNIAKNIAEGAMSFLKSENKILSGIVVAVAVLLVFKGNSEGSNSMVAVFSLSERFCLAGFIGMKLQKARTTNAELIS